MERDPSFKSQIKEIMQKFQDENLVSMHKYTDTHVYTKHLLTLKAIKKEIKTGKNEKE